ncbi:hypothetical protein IIB97_01850, partial [Patescibacteria group bacterium]|nr:hypothetical protein [Patescibacteria group bacterium]
LHEDIKVNYDNKIIKTTVGRLIFNSILPKKVEPINKTLNSKNLRNIISQSIYQAGRKETIRLLDDLKDMGYYYITLSGLSWGISDIPHIKEKDDLLQQQQKEILKKKYMAG